jgi:hypothetical protein
MDNKKFIDAIESLESLRILKNEIKWQEKHWGSGKGPHVPPTPLDERVNSLTNRAIQAKEYILSKDSEKALEEVRIIAAIAISILMRHPVQERK